MFIYLSIHRLLLVACCQLISNTMGILSTPYLSRQHITAYLYSWLLTPCFYLDSLCFVLCGCNTSVMRIYISTVASLSGYYQFPEPDSKMPGHDHSLRKLYNIEGLSNPSMVYNWICPGLSKEDCPYEALARIFSMYFKETSGINTSEDYLNFGWAAPLFSESDWSIMKHHAKKMHL